jgi:hypothetical protein
MKRLILFLAVVLSISGCYRTVYMNVQGDKNSTKMTLEQLEKLPDYDDSSWLHFFIFGLVPNEKVIDVAKPCGGAEHIASINTRQTTLQVLVRLVANINSINIYSPYDGHVVCDKPKMPEKSDSKELAEKSAPAPPTN